MIEVLLILTVLLAGSVWVFNRLVRDRNRVLAAWSDIDVQLKRRYDLVPQLVTAVKAYSEHEQATMKAVTELRTRSEASESLPLRAAIEDAMEQAVHQLIVVAEDYPDLKADQNFRQLTEQIAEVEDHLQYARRYYNGSVRNLNTRIQSFPHLLIARPMNFQEAEFFEVNDASERKAVQVELS